MGELVRKTWEEGGRREVERDYARYPVPRDDEAGEITYYLAVIEMPMGFSGMSTTTERYEFHARSSAEAIRRLMRRARFNDGRFNVACVEIEGIER